MADCKACRNYGKRCVPAANGKCDHFEPAIRCMVCGAIIPEGRHICLSCEGQEIPRTVPRIRTNGDKIRQMTDEELAKSGLLSCYACAECYQTTKCRDGHLLWLKQQQEEGEEDADD